MSQAFWDARAALGSEAGTRDRIAKQLEIEAIARYVKNGMTVLDVGCGDGETALELVKRFRVDIVGFDSSLKMIQAAHRNYRESGLWPGGPTPFGGPCYFVVGDVLDGGNYATAYYDLIYTQRCLINLPDWEAQRRAIGNIAQALKPGGIYVMLENSWEGLQAINDLRERVSLPRIEPPSHNRYLRDDEVNEYAQTGAKVGIGGVLYSGNKDGLRLTDPIDDYSSTYYYLSRVVNAALAAHEGKEPDYDSPINKLALSLPPLARLRGQGRIWMWRKV